jgi:hypothetical protein
MAKVTETLDSILKDIQAASGDIEATAVITSDGSFVAGSLTANVEKDRLRNRRRCFPRRKDRWGLGQGAFGNAFTNGGGGKN